MPDTRTRPRSKRRLPRITALAATTLVLAGGALATAPAASAADSSSCNSAWYGLNGHITANGVNLRSGPGTGYSVKGVLTKGTRTYMYCYKYTLSRAQPWDYIKVTSGANKGVKGWVREDFNSW
ncbi:hypothetical protein [Streptomyces sp. NPDC058145]|uniref:hypothetical protein n=1 Tax=Streptomyces sp. NPDC058145 TaxID=3346356 RepID=UPI0036E3462F